MPPASPLAQRPVPGPDDEPDLRVSIRPAVTPVVQACGVVDLQSAPLLREMLLWAMQRHGPRLAIDLEDVTFIDCAGINALVAARRRAQLEGVWVRVVRASPRARRIILLLGLEDAFALQSGPRRTGPCAPARSPL